MGSLTRRPARRTATFTGTALVMSASRVATAGLGGVEYTLRVNGAEISGFHWDRTGNLGQPVPSGSHVRLTGTLAKGPQLNRIQIDELTVLKSGAPPTGIPQVLEHCLQPSMADDIVAWLNGLCLPLHRLVTGVLSDPEVGRRFVTLPASRSHHHTERGGLIAHVMECVTFVRGAATPSTLTPHEIELTMVAAFLHDIGKVWTLTSDQKLSDLGHVAPHDALTLEVLASHLRQLSTTWPAGARVLRHMLTWTPAQSRYPEFPGTLLVRAADQFSTSTYLRRATFERCPDYYWKGHSRINPGQSFLRVPAP